MAAAGEGPAPYEGAGAGGKFRKRPFRRSQATPYDRPPTALRNPSNGTSSLLSKLVDPASKLLYASAHRLFGAFRNRLTLPLPERPPEANQESHGRLEEAAVVNMVDRTRAPEQGNSEGGNSANSSGATEISELEQMLKQRNFTRSEIEHLTELLRSRTSDLPVEDEGKREEPKLPNSPVNQNWNETDIFHASIPTPVVSSVVLNEDVASPAELAKAYMGSRPSKVSPSMLGLRNQVLREDSALLSNGSFFPKSPISLQLSFASKSTKGAGVAENGFTTPRSRGRSAIYSMARTPYSRIHSTASHKGIVSTNSGYGGPSSSLTPSQSAWEQEGPVGSKQMVLKRRSSVLEEDIGSVGPMRRIRQKPNLLSQGGVFSTRGREYGSGAAQYPLSSAQKLLLPNEPEHKVPKSFERNSDAAIPPPLSRYASVPTKSSEMATKILQHLDKMSPKGVPAGEKSPTKLTSNMLHGQALRSMDTLDSSKFLSNAQEGHKSEDLRNTCLPDVRDSTSQKDKVEENGSKMFAVPRNLLAPVNSDATVSGRDTSASVKTADSFLKVATEPPQKKRAFQMSAHEDFLEMDDEIHSNGVASTPLMEKNEKLETSATVSKTSSSEAVSLSKTQAFSESKIAVDSGSNQRAHLVTSNGSVVCEEKTGLTFSSSPPMSTTLQSAALTESTSMVNKFAPSKESNASPSSSISPKTVDKVQPFDSFSANEPSVLKVNSWSDAKPKSFSSLANVASVESNGQVKVPVSDKGDDGSTQNTVDGIRKPDSLPSAVSAATPKSGIFSFGIAKHSDLNYTEKAAEVIGNPETVPSSASAATTKSGMFSFSASAKQSDQNNGTLASSPSFFSSSAPVLASSNFSNQFSISSSTIASLSSSGITTTSNSSSGLSTSAAFPIVSFGSSVPPATSVSVASSSASALSTSSPETTDAKQKNDQESPFGIKNSSPFGGSSFASTGGSLFGFNSSAAPSTAKNQSQGSLFSTDSGSLANAQASTASTQSAPFQFGSSTASSFFSTSGITSSTPAISPFSSSASTSANPFSSTTTSFGQSSAASSSDAISSAGTAPSIFGTGWQPSKSSVFGSTLGSSAPSTGFSFGVSSSSAATTSSSPDMVFGSSATGASSGPSMFKFGSSAATTSSFPSFSQTQPVFGNSPPVFAGPSGNNDQMGMEDSMAEDTLNSPAPAVPAFGQPLSQGFMFGSAGPAPTSALPGNPFQFGGQPNSANPSPFQASSSVEFNAGGSFSLGSGGGGGDKSGRRMVRVSKNKNRKK